MMRYLMVLIIISAFFFIAPYDAFALHHGRPVTPYGDFCPRCSKYGACKSPMSNDDAKKALMDYYHKKGFNVEVEKKRGRFIRVKIMERGKVVDVIILDRSTGRIRSIY